MKNTILFLKSFTSVKLTSTSRRFVPVIAALAIISFSMAGCDNGTDPGGGDKPGAKTYTVTYNSAGGAAVAAVPGLASGAKVSKPADPKRAFDYLTTAGLWKSPDTVEYAFDGWKKADDSDWDFNADTVTDNITLTAKWTEPTPITLNLGGTNLVHAAVTHVNTDPGTYTLVVGDNVTVANTVPNFEAGVHLTVVGHGERRTITKPSLTNSIFTINGANRSLTLGDNITLVGNSGILTALVHVNGGASLTMNSGAQITGNTANNNNQGGGVNVTGGSSFTMHEGSLIHGNSTVGTGSGAGVRVSGNNSTFTMLGGTISGNSAGSGMSTSSGGVLLTTEAVVFRIVNGVIYGNNEGDNSNTASGGTGVNASYSAFKTFPTTLATAQYGTFVDGVWTPALDGEGNPIKLEATHNTIRVVNGVLQ
ncbi:MAG: InlB B-repeat-containing protein [Treponema sp.]|nr:InlB B-repeat-containing protein [Treponema sp.]